MKRLFGGSKDSSANTDSNATSMGRVAIMIVNTIAEASIEQEVAGGLILGKMATLILAVKELSSGEQMRRRLLEAYPEAYCRIEVWQLDLADFASVKSFGQRMHSSARLDLFITCPGISASNWEQTIDGYEQSLQVNVISIGLLCMLALPLMKRTATLPGSTTKPTIVVSSHECCLSLTPKKWDKSPSIIALLNENGKIREKDRFPALQLLNVYVTRELAALKIAKDIDVKCVIAADNRVSTGVSRFLPSYFRRSKASHAVTPVFDRCAQDYLHAALAAAPSAALIQHGQEIEPSQKLVLSSDGERMQRKIWTELCAIWRKQSADAAAVLMNA